MAIYLSFNIADSMFEGESVVARKPLTPERFGEIVRKPGIISCLNGSHATTIKALESRYNIIVHVPTDPPRILLKPKDFIIVISLRGLPRKTAGYQYDDGDLENATFSFALWQRVR